jgi:hypothetical protein
MAAISSTSVGVPGCGSTTEMADFPGERTSTSEAGIPCRLESADDDITNF